MNHFNRNLLSSCVLSATILAPVSVSALTLGEFNGTTVTMGGYVKADFIVTDYSDGTRPAGDLGSDFYIPSLTPVGGTAEDAQVDMHARQTRINFGTSTMVNDRVLKTFIELDFLATPNGNERITNSYTPRLRHATLTYGKWTFGQTWSTFMNTGALPETADFIGNTDFSIFSRQNLMRYTSGGWQFSIENPESTITPFGGGDRIVADDNSIPDFVARYNLKSGGLSLTTAILARELSYNDGAAIDSSTTSVGFSLSGKYVFGNKDDIRFGVNTGSGMGRYIGLNVSNGAIIDADGELQAIDSTAYYLAYRHMWSDKWRSTLTYSAISIDNDTDLTGTGAISTTSSARVNLFYSPTPQLSYGAELAQATKELESGADGNMSRFQLIAKLSF